MPRQPRSVYLRRRIGVASAALVVLLTGLYLPFTLLAPLGAAATTSIEHAPALPAPPAVAYPEYGASAFGAVGYPGVLGSAGTTEPLPMASVTKVVVALVVLQEHPLEVGEEGPLLTFDTLDEQYFLDQIDVNGTRQPVTAGASLSEHDVLELMLIASANNYALSLTRWAFGSQEAFLGAARVWLEAHGLASVRIQEPTGLDFGNVATAADLVELGKLALEHPVIAEIVATPETEIPGVGTIQNRNVLLGNDGIDGIKTGTLEETGANLLFSADHTVGSEVITIVGVVLGGPDQGSVRDAVLSMLATAIAGFQTVELAPAGQVWGEYSTDWGDTARAVTAHAITAVLWNGADIELQHELTEIRLAEPGTDVGDLTFTVGDRTFRTDLVLDAAIDDPGPWWRLSHPFELR